jgi:hypothetical protein
MDTHDDIPARLKTKYPLIGTLSQPMFYVNMIAYSELAVYTILDRAICAEIYNDLQRSRYKSYRRLMHSYFNYSKARPVLAAQLLCAAHLVHKDITRAKKYFMGCEPGPSGRGAPSLISDANVVLVKQ